jgi:hypothetical protein
MRFAASDGTRSDVRPPAHNQRQNQKSKLAPIADGEHKSLTADASGSLAFAIQIESQTIPQQQFENFTKKILKSADDGFNKRDLSTREF